MSVTVNSQWLQLTLQQQQQEGGSSPNGASFPSSCHRGLTPIGTHSHCWRWKALMGICQQQQSWSVIHTLGWLQEGRSDCLPFSELALSSAQWALSNKQSLTFIVQHFNQRCPALSDKQSNFILGNFPMRTLHCTGEISRSRWYESSSNWYHTNKMSTWYW